MENSSFTKEESQALKGMAILLMIFHHCFLASWCYGGFSVNFFPFTEVQINRVASFCNICVSIFALITGYGLSKALQREQGSRTDFCIRRYIKSMKAFWPVFVICLLAGCLIDGRTFSTYFTGSPIEWAWNLIAGAAGVSYLFGTPMFVHEWWYLSAVVLYIFLIPLLFIFVERYGWLVPVVVWVAIPRLLGSRHPVYAFSLLALLGIIFEREQVFERVAHVCGKWFAGSWGRTLKPIVGVAGLALAYKLYQWWPANGYDEFHFGVCPIIFIICMKECLLCFMPIRWMLAFLGKHSANMYFIHTVFLTYYLREPLFSMPWFMLTPLALCAVSLCFSLALEWGKRTVLQLGFPGNAHFLFLACPESSWPQKQQHNFWMWNLFWVPASGLLLGLFVLLLAPGPNNTDLVKSLLQNPMVVALNTLPVVFLNLILYTLVRRAWLAFSINSILWLTLSIVNYFKLMIRDDPFIFSDLLLLKEAGNMAGNYNLSLDPHLISILICILAVAVFLYFFVRGKCKRVGALFAAAFLPGVVGLALLIPSLMDIELYQRINAEGWIPTQDYISHGFIYPFIHSISDVSEVPPPGYDPENAAALMRKHPETDIPDEKKVNVIAVMLEAYNDFSKFDVPGLSADVYRTWNDLEQEGYSGDLMTNIFGGGTSDTERCFLTGYLEGYNFRSNTNAYPWYFRSQGYRVEGFHPNDGWFYNRENVNMYLGFENYYFIDDIESFAAAVPLASDGELFEEILMAYKKSASMGQPYFNYSLSLQGHGPYATEEYSWGERGSYVADDGTYTDTQHCMLENYFGSIASTNENLRRFTDSLRTDEEPVVLILFGDHNPAMDPDVYSAMGINLDTSTEEGFRNYYSTRYIIWANEAAKEILQSDFTGEGPAIGPYFLMNQVFKLCGWEGPSYLQALDPISDKIQVVHATGCCFVDETLVEELDPAIAPLLSDYQNLEYYSRSEFRYEEAVSINSNLDVEVDLPPSSDLNWFDSPIVAHALGTIDGRVGTNCAEAFIQSYDRGMRVFEVDLQITADGCLIARHDWEQISYYSLEQKFVGIMDLETFLNTPICFNYTPLDIDHLVSLMQEYPDIYLITDSKDTDEETVRAQMRALYEAVEKAGAMDLWERIVIQIYHEEMYDWVSEEVPVTNWIFTLYQIAEPDYEMIGSFCEEHGICVVTLGAERANKETYETLHEHNCRVYAHTVNRLREMLEMSYCTDGFYSDYVTPEELMRAIELEL